MPDTSPRGAPYTVGGIAPYGFVKTPPYNAKWVPDVGTNVGLYERLDFDTAASANQTQQSFTNPPFLVAGGEAMPGRVPSWMQSSDGIYTARRILRGYIRRETTFDFSTAAKLQDGEKSSNARLYFMYNPTSVTRTYAALDQQTQYLNAVNDPSGNAPPFIATADFELFFDRQQEVATLKDHPGCLLDLQVFDLLVGNGVGSGMGTGSIPPGFVGPIVPGSQDGLTTPSAEDNQKTSLMFNPSLVLVVNISPNLSFRGSLTSAQALFEKFSHRMTPTRMTLMLSLRLYSIGQEPAIIHATSAAATAAAQAAAAIATATAPSAATQAAADAANKTGRDTAMAWGEHWVDTVKYVEALRCTDAKNDSLLDFTGVHIPRGFDCSSFVSRCLVVAGLGPTLKVNPCSSTIDYVAIADAAKGKFASSGPTATTGGRVGESEHPWKVFPIHDYSANAMIDFIQAGDLILRAPSSKGHIAWIHAVTDKGKYEAMQAPSEGKPIEKVPISYTSIFTTYDYVLRAQPVPFVSSGATGHLSGFNPQ